MPTRTELEQAYRATTYRVFLPGGAADLRVDEPHPVLAAWLRTGGVGTWAIVTAANPASRQLDSRDNAERQARLECLLLEDGYEPYAGENLADGGDWPAEESCFIPGIPTAEAVALAQQFGQNAIVCGGVDGMPRLLWTGSGDDQKNRPI